MAAWCGRIEGVILVRYKISVLQSEQVLKIFCTSVIVNTTGLYTEKWLIW